MELSSPRYKAFTVSAGLSFWFFVITSVFGIFSFEYLIIFVAIVFPLMQILSVKVSKILDLFAIYNTKFFLGILFVFVISLYGIFFRILRIDLLRLKKQNDTYWLQMEELKSFRILKQY